MVVGTLVVKLQAPDSGSLKEKRMVVRSLTDRLRHTFNVAVAETGDQDLWQAIEIGVACVSSDSRHADEICQKVLNYIEREADAMLTGSSFELIRI